MTTFNPFYPRELFLAKLTDEELDSYTDIYNKLIEACDDTEGSDVEVPIKQYRQYKSDLYYIRDEVRRRTDPIKVTIKVHGEQWPDVILTVYSGLRDGEGMKLVLQRYFKRDMNTQYGCLPFGLELFGRTDILSDDQELRDATVQAIREWILDLKPNTFEHNSTRSYEHQNRAMEYVPGLEYANNH